MTPIRVLVVDDSAFFRQRLTRHLNDEPGMTVVGTAPDGERALAQVAALHPDVVTLDVEMPRLDGLATLRRLMAERPTPTVMLSAHTQRGATVTVQALMRGAVDVVTKPDLGTSLDEMLAELVTKIRIAAGAHPSSPPATEVLHAHPETPHLAPFHAGDPLIVIGASTGGPRALRELLSALPADLPASIVVVQHLQAQFTASLAQRLNQHAALRVQEAQEGDRLARGLVLLAPGGHHLVIRGRRVQLDAGPPRNHVRPSVDVTMESAVMSHGKSVIGVVLTGMGIDGTEGARSIKAVGGKVLAEDETTSVVYGMPRSVIEQGLADGIVPLPKVAPLLIQWVAKAVGRRGETDEQRVVGRLPLAPQ